MRKNSQIRLPVANKKQNKPAAKFSYHKTKNQTTQASK
jgi:hypothetical protein